MLTIEQVGEMLGLDDRNKIHYRLRKHRVEPDKREIIKGRAANLYKTQTILNLIKSEHGWKRSNARER